MAFQVERKQLFAAPRMQGVVLLRSIVYWSACIVVAALMLLAWRLLTLPQQSAWSHVQALSASLAPALVAALLMLPVIVIDTVNLSNRFLGPLVRLQLAVRRLGRGETVMPLHFRTDDQFHEFAAEFNALIARVEQLERRQATVEPAPPNDG